MKLPYKDERMPCYTHRKGTPPDEWEIQHRLHIDKSVDEDVYEMGNVYCLNSTHLDITDDSHAELQRTCVICLFCLAAMLAFSFLAFTVFRGPWIHSEAVKAKSGYWLGIGLLFILFSTASVLFGLLVHDTLRRYLFTLTHRPIRLNRKTRRIYAMRTKDADGIWEIPWDNSEFFCIGKRRVGGLSRSYPMYDIRHYQLDADGNIVRGFVLGQLMLSLELAQQQWEYYRRYMEHGPAGLPDPHRFWAPRESFREGFRISRGDICPGVLSFSNVVFFAFQLIDAICRWLMLATCSDPVWPEPIDAACKPEPNDPYARPYADDFVGFASGPYGRPSREDLERMWKQQDKRRFEGALTRVEAEALIRQAAAKPLDLAVQ